MRHIFFGTVKIIIGGASPTMLTMPQITDNISSFFGQLFLCMKLGSRAS
jgi:hypothetical protein